jgi:hypothetical protein
LTLHPSILHRTSKMPLFHRTGTGLSCISATVHQRRRGRNTGRTASRFDEAYADERMPVDPHRRCGPATPRPRLRETPTQPLRA